MNMIGLSCLVEEQLDGACTKLLSGLANSGDGNGGRVEQFDVVVTHDRQVFRDAQTLRGHLVQEAEREQVVGAEDCSRSFGRREAEQLSCRRAPLT